MSANFRVALKKVVDYSYDIEIGGGAVTDLGGFLAGTIAVECRV
ncbi:hypothetical protein [Paenibacillus sp.]|nr:hypothetical protein [Paenibacillus sp.]